MKITQRGVHFIKEFESFEANAYEDPASENGLPITIGYGSTRYADGGLIKLGDTITEQKASGLLEHDINAEASILEGLDLTQNQYDSLSSFIYNIGITAFRTSTIYKKIKKNPNDPAIRAQFMRWIKNDGVKVAGLVRRRKAEADIYFK